MKQKWIVGLTAAVMLMAAQALIAGPLGAAVTLQAGSLGFGVEVVKSMLPDLNARVGGYFFSYNLNQVNDEYDLEYDASLNLQSFSILADWHGLPAGFFLSGGLFINNNEVEATAISTKSYTYGGKEYTPQELGEFGLGIGFSKVAPYLGMGWGNPIKEGGRLGFIFNLGALYQNSPDVTMTASGMIEPTAEQQPKVEEDLEGLKLFPVMTFGLSFSF